MNEPTISFKGDIVTWTESLADYPASTYTMKYEFDGPGTLASITGTTNTDGSSFDFSLDLASAVGGDYSYRGYVENSGGTIKTTVTYGVINVRDISTSPYAQGILESIETAITNFLADGGVISLSIQGRSQTFTNLEQLQKARDYWKAQVIKYNKSVAIAQGRQKNTRFLIQY